MKILQKYWPLFLLLAATSLIVWPLFLPGYFSHHDDLQVMRIFEMRKCFADFQLPCRWVPDMGYGNGFPLYNFYPVLPYYIGGILSYFVSFIVAAKVLFFIPLVLGVIAMYLLVKELFGQFPGLVGAILYGFAPYRALDAYVRGAIAESFALALIPLVFYFSLKLIKEKKLINWYGLVFSLAAFLMSHNIMTLLFLPWLGLWLIYWLWVEKYHNLKALVIAFILSFCLAAFFLLPAFLEKDLVQTETLTRGDLDFRVHFVGFPQLFFNNSWGYGASVIGPMDTISFQIGWPLWWLAAGAFCLAIWSIFKRKKTKNLVLIGVFGLMFCISIWMTHNTSSFIWEKISLLHFSQFPWRFLSLTIFSGSILASFGVWILLDLIKPRLWQWGMISLLIIITISLNWNFFRPNEFYYSMSDQEKLSGDNYLTQQKASILDYLPKGVPEPREAAPDRPLIKSGLAEVTDFSKGSDTFTFKTTVAESSTLEMPIFDFPNWQVTVNNQAVSHQNNNFLKRISIELQPGEYTVTGKLYNTPVRFYANAISFLTIVLLIGVSCRPVFLKRKVY